MANWINADKQLPAIARCPKDGTRLISQWVEVQLSDGSTTIAYYHALIGWMAKGEVVGDFIYGYLPLPNVVNWKII